MEITRLGHGAFQFRLPSGHRERIKGLETEVWPLEPGKPVSW
jgi:hypothetical protein